MSVFVVDKHKKPLMPCSEKRARLLLERGKAVVHRWYPFTIRLKERVGGAVQPMRLKLDPGAQTTGVALVRDADDGQHVLHLSEITHRGKAVRKHIQQRALFRRRRRSAHLRYRAKRFDNRRRPKGWLPPSLRSRVDSTAAWATRYQRLAPISAISIEHVRFDMQAMQNPGKKAGAYMGRVAVRASGSFNIQTSTGVVQGSSWRHCHVFSRGDGYTYHTRARCSSQHASFLPTAKAEGLLEI